MARILIQHVASLLFLVLITNKSVGQQADSTKTKKSKRIYCNCSIDRLPRGKGLSIKYEYRPNFKITTTDKTGDYGNSDGTISNNGRWDIKAKIPLINKPYLGIVAGLKYNREEYKFESITNTTNPLYKSLEDRDLKSIGASLTVLKPMRSNKFWILRVNGNLNGDYEGKELTSDYLKFSISPALAWRRSDDLIYALGVTYSNNFRKVLIIPTVAVNYNIDKRWSIESVLPLFLKFRYDFNENFFWYSNIELEGASYRLDNTDTTLSHYQSLHLHRSEIKISTSLEKQISGWLWGGLEIGGVHNLSYNLTNSPNGNSDVIFKNKIADRFFISAGIYLIPPKRLYSKIVENLGGSATK